MQVLQCVRLLTRDESLRRRLDEEALKVCVRVSFSVVERKSTEHRLVLYCAF